MFFMRKISKPRIVSTKSKTCRSTLFTVSQTDTELYIRSLEDAMSHAKWESAFQYSLIHVLFCRKNEVHCHLFWCFFVLHKSEISRIALSMFQSIGSNLAIRNPKSECFNPWFETFETSKLSHCWVMDSKCAKCAMLALILQVAHVAHASEACETCETSLLQTVHNAHESHSENVKSLKSSCLSFIHIPKTGGGTIESARVKAAGTEWNATRFNFNPDARCFQKVREKRLSRFEGDHSHPNASFRFWGACDDQVQCSSDDATSLPSLQCNFMTHAGAHGRCSRWHVPPGLDFTVAASYTRNPFYKSTENSGNSFASLSTCDTFCVVRDPMQRLLSQLNWEIAFFLGNSSYCNSEFFEDWAARRLTGLNTRGDCHYVPQVYYVFENGDYKHGRQICRHVIKTDDLETKFPSLMKQYDLDVELADKHLHSGKCDLTPTPKTVEMVKTFYAGDYSAFGFWERQKDGKHMKTSRWQMKTSDIGQFDMFGDHSFQESRFDCLIVTVTGQSPRWRGLKELAWSPRGIYEEYRQKSRNIIVMLIELDEFYEDRKSRLFTYPCLCLKVYLSLYSILVFKISSFSMVWLLGIFGPSHHHSSLSGGEQTCIQTSRRSVPCSARFRDCESNRNNMSNPCKSS